MKQKANIVNTRPLNVITGFDPGHDIDIWNSLYLNQKLVRNKKKTNIWNEH